MDLQALQMKVILIRLAPSKIPDMRNLVFILLIILSSVLHSHAQGIPSPTEFLGDEYGTQFTPHHRLVDYFQELSKDDRVDLQQYGNTSEGRPLYTAIITSTENHKNIEAIRKKNLALAQMGSSSLSDESALPIVWLSYSVHGNEAGGSESSMNVLYSLLTDESLQDLLSNSIVIIDPSLNPDGYSRYSHWVRGNSGKFLHPNHIDVEHMEPWPGGRVNHYLYDLNRDWAWQTQIETQQRIVQYNKWMPHVHADLHEMGYDDHYYFAPAAEPFHSAITNYQRSLQTTIGENHAAIFDKNSWLYFTKETFDLLYPSYGDTYPTFNGSVGMTYEQAGHGMAGRSIEMSNRKKLTLQDRIDHHTATSISTIATAVKEKESIISNFKRYFEESVREKGKPFKGYLVKDGTTMTSFKKLLERNGIEYSEVNEDQQSNGYSYFNSKNQNFQINYGDVYIPTAQPKAVLLSVLMEEEPILADSVTYDITSWCIPFAYGLETYGINGTIQMVQKSQKTSSTVAVPDTEYGLYVKWSESMDSKLILKDLLLEEGLIVKRVVKEIELKDVKLNLGDLVILKGDQYNDYVFEKGKELLQKHVTEDYGYISSGFSLKGSDLGGSGLQKMDAPKVLTIFGNGVNANSYGQVWYYFEHTIQYPISRVDIENFSSIELSSFNTLILPDGYYSISERDRSKLVEWIKDGGKLISIGGANRNFSSDKEFALNRKDELKKEETSKEAEIRYRKRKYEGAERMSIAGSIPGAIFKTEIDKTHPLCYGLDTYYTLKNSRTKYPLLDGDSYNPIRIPKSYNSYGFIGSKIKDRFEENAVFSVQRLGSGQVIYMFDNPLFRSFWKSGEVVFSNALFQM